ncbi:hypothetical protein IHV38_25305 [Escherichia coli]|uniref:hypothetical protein n=1 Tax=Escherichia coli TaxID=562 RepID=UPI001CE134DB|nr:hypothetical protein [Escherichia coli]MCA4845645.1 hypothetical protein [Escherichia coli]
MLFQKDKESVNKRLFKELVKMFFQYTAAFLIAGPWLMAICFYPATLFIGSSKFGDGPFHVDIGFIDSLLIRPTNAVLNAFYFPTSLEGWAVTWGVLGLAYVYWLVGFLWGAICALLDIDTGSSRRSGGNNSGAGVYAHVGTRGASVTAGTRFAGGWLSIGKRGVSWRKSKKLF